MLNLIETPWKPWTQANRSFLNLSLWNSTSKTTKSIETRENRDYTLKNIGEQQKRLRFASCFKVSVGSCVATTSRHFHYHSHHLPEMCSFSAWGVVDAWSTYGPSKTTPLTYPKRLSIFLFEIAYPNNFQGWSSNPSISWRESWCQKSMFLFNWKFSKGYPTGEEQIQLGMIDYTFSDGSWNL